MRYDIISSDSDCGNVYSIGCCSSPEETRFGPGKRNQYIIHYVLSGSGFFNGNRVDKNHGFLIYPGMSEHYFPDSENPWSFLWIISETNMESFFEKYKPDPNTGIFEFDSLNVLLQTEKFVKESRSRFYPSSVLQERFLRIFNSHTVTKVIPSDSATLYFSYAVKYIQSNIFRPLKVSELTQMLGITQPYLYGIFMQKCSLSPKGYINKCKLDEAERLLKESDMSVTEIANSVGYTDSLSFSKFFKTYIGTSPTRFRKDFSE